MALESRKLEVSRSKWIRGTGPVSTLYNEVGHMNILGFVGRKLGVSGSDLMFMYSLPDAYPLMHWSEDEVFAFAIIQRINDDPEWTEPEREHLLTQLLGQLGFSVEFIDG